MRSVGSLSAGSAALNARVRRRHKEHVGNGWRSVRHGWTNSPSEYQQIGCGLGGCYRKCRIGSAIGTGRSTTSREVFGTTSGGFVSREPRRSRPRQFPKAIPARGGRSRLASRSDPAPSDASARSATNLLGLTRPITLSTSSRTIPSPRSWQQPRNSASLLVRRSEAPAR